MKTIKFLISALLLACYSFTYSQVYIGPKTDVNGEIFDGYFDPLIYNPTEKISYTRNIFSFEVGHYYDMNGKKHRGLIKYQNRKILFKKHAHANIIGIKPENASSIVIGIDSLISIKNYQHKGKVKSKPIFVQYLSTINNQIFVKRYKFNLDHGMAFNNEAGPIIITYYTKKLDEEIWIDITNKTNQKELFLKLLKPFNTVIDEYKRGKYNNEDVLPLIKSLEYSHKLKNKIPIYYDKYWLETDNKNRALYHALIEDKTDSIWTLTYYKKDVKLYQIKYSSFYPNTKSGNFLAFYNNGKIRKSIAYANDKAQKGKTFYKTGSVKTEFEFIEIEDSEDTEKSINKRIYKAIYNQDGENIMNSKGNAILTYTENGTTYTQEYQDYKPTKTFFKKDNQKTYQLTSEKSDIIDLEKLKKKFSRFLCGENLYRTVKANAQGILLVNICVNQNGLITKYEILNQIYPELDNYVKSFLENNFSPQKRKPYKFGKLIVEGNAVEYEFILPIEFNINRFFRPANKYHFHFNHWHMHNHMMNNFKPNIPTRF